MCLKSYLTVVHGSNSYSTRNQLWNDLGHINRTYISEAWAVLGDFNIARFTDEKLGGKTLPFAKLASSNDCITKCQLMDLKHVGSKWSWHNSTIGLGRIIGRLDRVLCSHLWIDSLAKSFYEYHCFATSDHAPMSLHFTATSNSGPKPILQLLGKLWRIERGSH